METYIKGQIFLRIIVSNIRPLSPSTDLCLFLLLRCEMFWNEDLWWLSHLAWVWLVWWWFRDWFGPVYGGRWWWSFHQTNKRFFEPMPSKSLVLYGVSRYSDRNEFFCVLLLLKPTSYHWVEKGFIGVKIESFRFFRFRIQACPWCWCCVLEKDVFRLSASVSSSIYE